MKADPKAADAAAATPAGASTKKLVIIILAAVLALGAIGGGAAWFFLRDKKDSGGAHKEARKSGAQLFLAVDPFTVNLQPETGDQYLQVSFTLQVDGADQVELIKLNMPKVRSRLLMLLSSKKASELITSEGKQVLAAQIIEQIKQPFEERGPQQEVSDVLFTSFIIQ
ncbi:MAG: flagellar basal body-associated protein FliL [Burkholderiaceae bacterium]|nr:flagellar basal body-associated protein FliL [Burkholderiaceae bacterium]